MSCVGLRVRTASCPFLALLTYVLATSRCIHDTVQAGVSVLHLPPSGPATEQGSVPRARRALPESRALPIRIRAWYPPAETLQLSLQQRRNLEAAVQEVTQIIAGVLAVNPVPEPLLLSRDINKYCRSVWRNPAAENHNKCGYLNPSYHGETCLEIMIPDDHLAGFSIWPEHGSVPREVMKQDGTGVPDADFLLYVKVANTEKCKQEPSVIAYASYCQLDTSDRPVAGAIVFCHAHLASATLDHQNIVQVSLHEVLHTLGFSRGLFDKWKDCSQTPGVGMNCSSRARVTNTDEMGQVRIFTPTVIQKMAAHLGMQERQLGAPLENKDAAGPSSPSSHWEARLMQGSLMLATFAPVHLTQLDDITLAAFADTGWYQVNTSASKRLVWGRGAGPVFGLTTTCKNSTSGYFCTGNDLGCHYLHMDKGICSSDDFLDGCRMYKPLTNGSECWKVENAANAGHSHGEIYHSSSRCFFSSLSQGNSSFIPATGRCYRHRCTAENTYQVQVEGLAWSDCPAGGSIQVPGYQGLLFCPDERLCLGFHDMVASLPGERILNASLGSALENGAAGKKVFTFQINFQGPDLDRPHWQLLTSALTAALADSSAIPRCHFQSPMLTASLVLTVELWVSVTCAEPQAGVLRHKLNKTFHGPWLYRGSSYIPVSTRFLEGPGPTSPDRDIVIVLASASVATLLLAAAIGALLYHQHRQVGHRVGAAPWIQA
ncbi:leishmanolysin-like peptidase 2 isoform X2 [Rhinatrema bivittatum]|uniref:leishmanolysin-like peptidase 2 isoform X2 n=1 Tax=Rhinatrema bivittatum TaxID=194408 RepID=UPI0011260492|nr:leishmanolysin-like peptidase 2 isoform X2 [Rhinatrema bivittatum]